MRVTALFFSIALILFSFGSVMGQGIYVDNVVGLNGDGTIPHGGTLTFNMRITGDGTAHLMLNNGFTFSSADVAWTGVTADFVDPNLETWFDFIMVLNLWANGSVEDTVGLGLLSLFGTGLPAGYDDVAFQMTVGPVDGVDGGQFILDSSWYPPSNPWMWDIVGTEVAWGGPYTYLMEGGECTAPAITSTPGLEGTVGELYTYAVVATGDPVPDLSFGGPVGMTLTDGLIEWTPDAAGDFAVAIIADNGCEDPAVQNFSIHVEPPVVLDPYTYCTPQPTIIKVTDNVLNVHIVNENPDDVDFGSIRVQSKIPPYAGVTVVDGEIITTAFIMRFLGSSGFRPITGSFEATYTVDYDYTNGTAADQLVGDYALMVNPGDVTFDGEVTIDDMILMCDFLWRNGDVATFEEYKVPELMDINQDGNVDPRDVIELKNIIGM